MRTAVSDRPLQIALVVAAGWLAFTSAPAAPGTPPAALAIPLTFDPALPPEPELDNPPRVTRFEPLALSAALGAQVASDHVGRVTLRIDASGAVKRVEFGGPRLARPVAESVEATLQRWHFAPPMHHGEAVAATVHLVYSAPTPSAAAEGGRVPARAVLTVLPAYPAALRRPWSTGNSQVVTVSGSGPPQSTAAQGAGPGGSGPRSVAVSPQLTLVPTPWFSGHVTLRIDVTEDGSVENPEVVRSTGSIFEPAAVAAALHWKFAPATADGKPVRSRVVAPIALPGEIENPPPLFLTADTLASGEGAWDDPPRMRHVDLPVYPADLFAKRVRGRASARVHVDASGAITEVDLLESTAEEFGLALVASIERCVHEAARRGGRRVDSTLIRTAVFDPRIEESRPVGTETPGVWLALEPDSPEVVPADVLDAPPRLIVGRPPAFARQAAASSGAISATVEFVINPRGEVREPRLVDASQASAGYAAVQAVASWLYAPPLKDGRPVATRHRVVYPSPSPNPTG